MKAFNLLLSCLFMILLGIGCSSSSKKVQSASSTDSMEQTRTTGQLLNESVQRLGTDIKSCLSSRPSVVVAVLPFTTIHGERNDFGLFLTDKLTSELSVGSKHFEIVERARIDEAMEEIKLGQTGLIRDETIQEAGQALGADIAIIGTLMDLGIEVDINLRIVEVTSLEVLGRANHLIVKDEVIENLLARTAKSPDPIRPKTPDTKVSSDKLFYFDDFKSPDQTTYTFTKGHPIHKMGNYSFNPEAGHIDITTGDNRDLKLNFKLKKVIKTGRIEVEFLPTRFFPKSGAVLLYAMSSQNNGYFFNHPGSVYKSSIGQMLSGQSISSSERGGDKFALNKVHKVVLEFTSTQLKAFMDGQLIFSVPNSESFGIEEIQVNFSQMNCFVKSIKVEEL